MASTRKTATKPASSKTATSQPALTNGPASSSNVNNGHSPAVQMTLNHDQIAQRAFAIWVAKGKPVNQDKQNWTDAENQLRQELARRA